GLGKGKCHGGNTMNSRHPARRIVLLAALATFAAAAPSRAQQKPPDQPTPAAATPTSGQQAPEDHATPAAAPSTAPPALDQSTLEIYGFGQADAIVDGEQNNPDWYDVMRPSRLPASKHQFGEDRHFHASPRQTRFGARATIPTSNGEIKAT